MKAEEILKKLKKNNDEGRVKYLSNLITRVLISVILVLVSMIYVNYSEKNLMNYKEKVFSSSLAFNKFNNIYEKYLGKLTNESPSEDKMVFKENIEYKSSEKFLDGTALEVGRNYLVPSLQSGIVVFNGEKDGYGKTLIIQGIDGVDIWYSLVDVHEIKLYDYVEKGSLLGESSSDDIVITLNKNGEYLEFDAYLQNS